MKPRRSTGFASRSIVYILSAALAAGLGLFAAQRFMTPEAKPAGPTQQQLKAVTLITPARVLQPFRLTFADGSELTPATWQGRWTVVFLGFTHCPDVCPTTLAELKKAQDAWAALPELQRPRVLFVSVDGERDTPEKTGEYARYFHPATLAASGDPAALEQFAQSLGLVFAKTPLDDGGYTMDHSATLVVIDPQGRQAGLIRPPLRWSDVAGDLRALAAARP